MSGSKDWFLPRIEVNYAYGAEPYEEVFHIEGSPAALRQLADYISACLLEMADQARGDK